MAFCWNTTIKLASVLLLTAPLVYADLNPTPFELHFNSRVKGMQVSAQQSLTLENGIYQLQQITKAPLISIEEKSTFRLDENFNIIPLSYDYQRSVFGTKLNRKNRFSDDLTTATYQENKKPIITINTPANITDELSFIIPIQQWLKSRKTDETTLNLHVLDEKRVREHQYQVLGTEWLDTNLGWINTTIIERVRTNNDKKTRIWLANDWDYLVIKMQHIDEDEGQQTIVLNHGKLLQEEIVGSKTAPPLPAQ